MNPISRIRPGRPVLGMSAILLPFNQAGDVDWIGFEAHVRRTLDAGLIPAVNMDTGYANLIDDTLRRSVLERTTEIASGERFVAGAFVGDFEGAEFQGELYLRQMEAIESFGGQPIVFQSFGLTAGNDQEIFARYQTLAQSCDHFLAFELGQMFAPFGKIYSLELYEQLMSIPQCTGAKHSSLSRDLEWQRLDVRDRVRPEFRVLTGNDLAIDMVMYGSDYLLGLSTFAPDLFARRDAMWAAADPAFYELNDRLQYLGFFAFRNPVPAYKHSAAQFLHLRGWITTDQTHPGSPQRPESDRAILQEMLQAWGILQA